MAEQCTETALHFEGLSGLLERYLPAGRENGKLDLVCSTMVLEHVPDERPYLAEIRRMVRSGGRTYLTTVFKKP